MDLIGLGFIDKKIPLGKEMKKKYFPQKMNFHEMYPTRVKLVEIQKKINSKRKTAVTFFLSLLFLNLVVSFINLI